MRTTRLPLAAALLLPLLTLGATPDTVERYTIDRSHSRVGFAVRHMAVATVRGEFRSFEGHLMLNTEDITQSTAHVVIQAASIDTGHERRDADLRGSGFFEAEQFPTITFDGQRVELEADGYVLVGELTLRDVRREVRIPFELTGPIEIDGRRRLGAEGELRINRKEFGLTWNNVVEGVAVVSDEVRIELAIEAVTPRPSD